MGEGATRRIESDSFFLDGRDVEDIRRAMDEKIGEIRTRGAEVESVTFEETQAGDGPYATARFEYRLPAEEVGAEVEFNRADVEDASTV